MAIDPDETRHNISESADKIQLKTTVKRGGDTRDEDKLKIRVKGDDPGEAAAQLANTLDALAKFNVVDTLRKTQPFDG